MNKKDLITYFYRMSVGSNSLKWLKLVDEEFWPRGVQYYLVLATPTKFSIIQWPNEVNGSIPIKKIYNERKTTLFLHNLHIKIPGSNRTCRISLLAQKNEKLNAVGERLQDFTKKFITIDSIRWYTHTTVVPYYETKRYRGKLMSKREQIKYQSVIHNFLADDLLKY